MKYRRKPRFPQVAAVEIVVWRCYLLSYRGRGPIDYPAQGDPNSTFPPSQRRDLWGVGTVFCRTLIYPLCFITCGTRDDLDVFFRCASVSVNKKKRSKWDSNPWPGRCEMWECCLLSFREKRQIDYPAQGNPYNSSSSKSARWMSENWSDSDELDLDVGLFCFSTKSIRADKGPFMNPHIVYDILL